ncbi:NAD(P)/FAD-dependent oxidoreductase [Paraclostridium sp. AKS73]
MKLTVSEMLTIKAAMVTSGGVSVKEINSSNLESKIIKNLFFAGEVIDVDAETGGYNLQIAFSTGYLAGSDY